MVQEEPSVTRAPFTHATTVPFAFGAAMLPLLEEPNSLRDIEAQRPEAFFGFFALSEDSRLPTASSSGMFSMPGRLRTCETQDTQGVDRGVAGTVRRFTSRLNILPKVE